MRRRDLARDDRGVVLILAAITLVTLLVLSAFAIDVGGAYNARRQDQTAADAAALAAGSPTVMANTQLVVTEVLDRLNDNLSEPLTLADLNTCGDDTERLPVVAQVGGQSYNCISFNNARTQVRVRVPPRGYETTFARLVGVDEIEHTAFAIAGSPPRGEFGGVLPFGMPSGAGTGYVCLKTGPQGQDACEGPTTGNFGYLNFTWFGNAEMGTSRQCNGGGNTVIATNISFGVDHDLSLINQNPHGATPVYDQAACSGGLASPNGADAEPGNMPNVLGGGIYSGSFVLDGQGRLRRVADHPPDYFKWTTVGSYVVDDNPLWEFIDPDLSASDDVPASCLRSQFAPPGGGLGDMSSLPSRLSAHLQSYSLNERMTLLLARCISHYERGEWTHAGYSDSASGCSLYPCSDPVFARSTVLDGVADVQQTPRFGYVPVINQVEYPNGRKNVSFIRFRAVFIQRICIGNVSCTEFDPGVGMSGGPNDDRVAWFTAFAFPDDMLPFGIGSPTAPMDRPSTAVLLR